VIVPGLTGVGLGFVLKLMLDPDSRRGPPGHHSLALLLLRDLGEPGLGLLAGFSVRLGGLLPQASQIPRYTGRHMTYSHIRTLKISIHSPLSGPHSCQKAKDLPMAGAWTLSSCGHWAALSWVH
jgi:hypothetical protein